MAIEEHKELYQVWDEFLKEWPVNKVETMSLDQYTKSGSKNTFIWWLEYGLKGLGRFTGDSLKAGIYSRKDTTKKTNAKGRMYQGEYAWRDRYGDAPDDAFKAIRSAILKVIYAVQKGDIEAIDQIQLGETLKWKVAFHYQDRKKPIVVNVFKREAIESYVGKKSSSTSELHRLVFRQDYDLDVLIDLGKEIYMQWKKLNGLKIKTSDQKEVSDRMKSTDDFPLNQILYGPPGTGKTYNTVLEAVKICEPTFNGDYKEAKEKYDNLKKEGRIEFITFHQSYGYEEFIEGIKPVLNQEDESESLQYKIEHGIFKRLCKRAEGNTSDLESALSKLKEECEEGPISLRTPKQGKSFSFTYQGGDRFCVKPDSSQVAGYSCGATFKTIEDLYMGRNETQTSTRSYSKAVLAYLKSKYGLKDYEANIPSQRYVLIIDEINRGNMSKIFGELITLIEDDKRIGSDHAMLVHLPVSRDEFGVPKNLHIIGTMNTADRSIAMMDTALRRRFEFKEMMPKATLLETKKMSDDKGQPDSDYGIEHIVVKHNGHEVEVGKMLRKMNERIEVLYDREHTIGHAYFMSLNSESSIDDLSSIFENKIIPLLAEYFFEDWEKIRMVLGDNQKKKHAGYQFITVDEKKNFSDLFGSKVSDVDYLEERKVFARNEKALSEPESYIGIYNMKSFKEKVDQENPETDVPLAGESQDS